MFSNIYSVLEFTTSRVNDSISKSVHNVLYYETHGKTVNYTILLMCKNKVTRKTRTRLPVFH